MSKGKLLAVCCVWLVILGVGAVAWKVYDAWTRDRGYESVYGNTIKFALDSFSGYAVFRSPEFAEELSKQGIKLELIDDGADYSKRIRALKDRHVQMAVFTVDALIKVGAELGDPTAAIVAVVDETTGADAMVADKRSIPNIDALNDSRTRFVLTPDSPSETLARVVRAQFKLNSLIDDPFVPAADAADVFRRYRNSKRGTHEVFVLWEPYVSLILENPNMHKVVDSSRFRGYIVDVIVADKDYLAKNGPVVEKFVEAYFRARYAHRQGMAQLVLADAKALDTPLTGKQAANLEKGIWWKNIQENYAHLGLLPDRPLQHIEDIIGNITDVLEETGAVPRDHATHGKAHLLYSKKILSRLHARKFYPGPEDQDVRQPEEEQLEPLTREQADRLVGGTVKVEPLVFARGMDRLTAQSELVLDDLVQKLTTWPQYYVVVRGNALRDDDPEVFQANKTLAEARAKRAAEYLVGHGISQNRVYAIGGTPMGRTSVSFVLGLPTD